MGRHSASDDDGEDVLATVAAPIVRSPRPGRHAQPGDDEPGPESEEQALPPDDRPAGPAPEISVEAEPVRPKPRPGKGNQSTAADLALLRERSDVRARCIAAVVVPFVLYTAVLSLAGAMHVYLIWVWIPLVAAGVIAGSILDSAHRRRESEPPQT